MVEEEEEEEESNSRSNRNSHSKVIEKSDERQLDFRKILQLSQHLQYCPSPGFSSRIPRIHQFPPRLLDLSVSFVCCGRRSLASFSFLPISLVSVFAVQLVLDNLVISE